MNENTFYAVQRWVDSFGHDTTTEICFKTREECREWIKNNQERYKNFLGTAPIFCIVEQSFGKPYENTWY